MEETCRVKPGDILSVKYPGYSDYCIATGTVKEFEIPGTGERIYSFETIGIRDFGSKVIEIKWLSENKHIIGLSNTLDKMFKTNSPEETVRMAENLLGKAWDLCAEEFATTCRYGMAKVLYNTGPTIPIRCLKDLAEQNQDSVWATKNQGY